MMKRARCFALVVVLGLVPARASGQSTDPVAATELFKQGRDALAHKNYALACVKFEDSLRLDPKVGTLINLAECEERLDKLASARQHLQRAIDLASAQGDDRAELARTRFAAIDKRVPRLTVILVSTVDGVVVRRDGVVLGAGSLATPLPVELGKHTIEVSASHRETKHFEISLEEGEQKSLAVEAGAEEKASLEPSRTTKEVARPEPHSNGMRTAGWIAGGVGVAAVATGAVFALVAMGDNSKSKENGNCDGASVCNKDGFDAREGARTKGDIATGFFIGGGVLVAAGVALVLLSPSSNEKTATRVAPLVTVNGAGLVLGRAF